MKKILFVPLLTLITVFSFGFIELGLNMGELISSAPEANAQGSCAVPLDIMLLLDASNSMDNGKFNDAKNAARTFVTNLSSNDRAGLVSFDKEAVLRNHLEDEFFIGGFGKNSGSNIEAAIYLAQEELVAHGRIGAKKVIILLSDGRPQSIGLPPNGVDGSDPEVVDPYYPSNQLYGTTGDNVGPIKGRIYSVGRAWDAKTTKGITIHVIAFGNLSNTQFNHQPRVTVEGIASGSGHLHEIATLTEAGLNTIYANIASAECVQAPTINLKANGVDGPLAVVSGTSLGLSWTSTNATSCVASSGWSGTKALSGSESSGSLTSSTTFVITCTGAGGTATDSVQVNIATTPSPTVNLTADGVGGSLTIPYNTDVPLSWFSQNASSCTASASPSYSLWSGGLPSLSGGKYTNSLTQSYTFTITCTGAGGTATDSVTVNVTSPSPVPTVDLTANGVGGTVAITSGTSVNLGWESTNATSCVASSGWSGTKALSGSESSGSLTSSTTFVITCTGAGGTATDSVQVNIATTPSPTVNLTADGVGGSLTIPYNTDVPLSWFSQNASSCTASASPSYSLWSGGLPSLSGGKYTNSLTQSYTFTITCTGAGGTATDSVTVNVTSPSPVPTVDLTANGVGGTVAITSGTSVNLGWESTNATSCVASSGWSGTKALSGTEQTGIITFQKTYTITCTGAGGTASDSVVVTIAVGTLPAVDISANNSNGPITITSGSSAELRWTSANATSCTASGGWSGQKALFSTSEFTGSLTTNKTFIITCANTYGTATDSVTVNVAVVTVPEVDIKANGVGGALTIPYNTPVTLEWTSANVTNCTATAVPGWSGSKPTSGTQQMGNLTSSQTYRITCFANGEVTDFVQVNVAPPLPPPSQPVVDIKANGYDGPITTGYNDDVLLSWSSGNVDSCTAFTSPLNSWWRDAAFLNGAKYVYNLTQSYTFTITCSGSGQQVSDSVVVMVEAPAPTQYNVKAYRQNLNGSLLSGTEARVVVYPNNPITGVPNQTVNPATFSIPSGVNPNELVWRATYPPKRIVSYGVCSYLTGGVECNPSGFNEVSTTLNGSAGIYGGLLGGSSWDTYTRKVVARYADYDLEIYRVDQNSAPISGTQASIDSRKISGVGIDDLENQGPSSSNVFVSPRIPYRAGSSLFKQNAQITDLAGQQESWGVCTYNRGAAPCTPLTYVNFPYSLTPLPNNQPYCNGSLCALNVMNFAQDGKVLRVVVKYGSTLAPQDWEYSLSANPMTIAAGGGATSHVWKYLVNGIGLPITLSEDSVPSGLSVFTITNNPCTPECMNSVLVTASPSIPVGNYTIRLKAAGGGLPDKFVDMPVAVTAYVQPAFNYWLTGSSVVIPRGQTGTTPVTIHLEGGGISQPVTLSPVSVSDKLTLNNPITNNGCNPTCTATLSITVDEDNVLSGTPYPIHLQAETAGLANRSVYVYVTVPIESDDFDYLISADPVEIPVGGSGNGVYSMVNISSGATENVGLAPAMVPGGLNVNSITPTACSPDCSGVVNISVSDGVPLGQHNILLRGVSESGVVHTVQMPVNVVAGTPPPCEGVDCDTPCEGVDCDDDDDDCPGPNCDDGDDDDDDDCPGPNCDDGDDDDDDDCPGPNCDDGDDDDDDDCPGPNCGTGTNPIGPVTCGAFDSSGTQIDTAFVNSFVTWRVIGPEDNGFEYLWNSSDSNLDNRMTREFTVRQGTIGTKTATVTVSNGSDPVSCTVNIIVQVQPVFGEV